jgi:mannose PTS system EIIA component
MSTGILIIAHAPLASALRQCALHVYPEAAQTVLALDVDSCESPEASLKQARVLLDELGTSDALILTDVFGATPCNVAQKLVDGQHSRLVAGVNLPMLLRTVNYRQELPELLATRAVAGGSQCIMQVGNNAPQNQSPKHHDYQNHDDQQ